MKNFNDTSNVVEYTVGVEYYLLTLINININLLFTFDKII